MKWKRFWNESPQVTDADFCRQVGRTFHGAPMSDRELDLVVNRLLVYLQPAPEERLIDVACGNGLISSRLAVHFRRIVGVDFSRPLIERAQANFARDNVEYLVGDALALDVPREPYDCALISAAFQFLNPAEAARLLRSLRLIVKDNGRVVLADVADADRIWNFYRGATGRLRYFADIVRGTEVIGHWWRPADLHRVAAQEGWTLSVHYQGTDLPNHYFRYDAVLTRADSDGGRRRRALPTL